jgi:hypothetical protein
MLTTPSSGERTERSAARFRATSYPSPETSRDRSSQVSGSKRFLNALSGALSRAETNVSNPRGVISR